MNDVQAVVVGGGVAGLNVARLLSDAGVAVELHEARGRLGGRVLSVDRGGVPSGDGFDLGPSWFWPQAQPVVSALADSLGVSYFPQHSDGDVIFERMSRERPHRYSPVDLGEPESMRFTGGAAALVRALAARVPPDRICLNSTVTGISLANDGVTVTYRAGSGQQSRTADLVVVALPPRLFESTFELHPRPEQVSRTLWSATPTWMAGQAKFFAVYAAPFWRTAGLSGTAQSLAGPMLEIHDATTESGHPALFGFLGMGASDRLHVGERALTEACLGQLVRLFGPEAKSPVATILQDWATEPLTSTAEDLTSSGHPTGAAEWVRGAWAARLILAGSETSPHEAGYLAGAIEASAVAAERIIGGLHA